MKLTNRVVLVTGGGRGIGRAIASTFAAEGASVAVVARTESEVAGVAQELRALSTSESMYAVCDVADRENVEIALADVRERLGPIDILINNAGVAESAPLVKTSDELWQRHLNINLTGTFYFMRSVVPSMIERGWGRVINIASIAGKTGAPYISAYAASKHGVLGLTRAVALEVASSGVTVNAICPGYVDTDMTTRAVENIEAKTGLPVADALDAIKRMSPQNRLITSDEVASLALLLATEEGRGINGQAINVDGGSVLF